MRAACFIAGLALVVGGCDPGVFADFEDAASTRALASPGGFRDGAFGLRLASVRATAGGVDVTRVGVVGGTGSGYAVYGMWTGTGPEIALSDEGCDDPEDLCPLGFGADVAGIPAWNGLGACFVITAPDAGETRVFCEGPNTDGFIAEPALAADEIGRSVAGVPVAGNPAGVAFLGAPGAGSGAGALYRLAEGVGMHLPVPLPASIALAAGDRFGDAMAATVAPPGSITTTTTFTDPVVLAVTASGSDRVYVLAVGDDGGSVSAELLACLDGGDGFGMALAFGDLTGEGDPELVVGEAADAIGRSDAVSIFSLASLAGEAGCGVAAAPAPETVPCPAGLDVECAGSGFGSALAVGDVDGDAVGDLLVGAPFAVVSGERGAGAAFLLSGSMSGLASVGETSDALVDSHPESNARLGTAVAMVGSHLGVSAMERMEPVASAPGEGVLFFFLCSELETIASLADSRCLELD